MAVGSYSYGYGNWYGSYGSYLSSQQRPRTAM